MDEQAVFIISTIGDLLAEVVNYLSVAMLGSSGGRTPRRITFVQWLHCAGHSGGNIGQPGENGCKYAENKESAQYNQPPPVNPISASSDTTRKGG